MTKLEALVSVAHTLVRFREPPETELPDAVRRAVRESSRLIQLPADDPYIDAAMREIWHRYGIS